MPGNKENLILAGDVGGTKTTLAIFPDSAAPCPALFQQKFLNAGIGGIGELIRRFLEQTKTNPAAACLGITFCCR